MNVFGYGMKNLSLITANYLLLKFGNVFFSDEPDIFAIFELTGVVSASRCKDVKNTLKALWNISWKNKLSVP